MPVLQLVGVGAVAPTDLLESICRSVAQILSVPEERVWAYWVPVQRENLWRPGFIGQDQRAPICLMYCRSVYEPERIASVLDELRKQIAIAVGCSEQAVFAIVQRVKPGELLAFGSVWVTEETRDLIELKPVGIVRADQTDTSDDCWGGIVSAIELDATRFSSESVSGLQGFSHVDVVFFLHRVPERNVEMAARHPRGRQDWPRVGIFAQRAKDRPNRIGLSTCQVVRVDGSTIWVKELDAVDGTPVLDIKPHFKQFGPRGEFRQPAWAEELMSHYFDERE